MVNICARCGIPVGPRQGNPAAALRVHPANSGRILAMKGVLAWLIGIPIPIIILLYLFNVI